MKTGEIRANQQVAGGHFELAVDFERQRIAITGSSRDLTIYDFDGKELVNLEDASTNRSLCVAFSPKGDRVAVGGWANAVEIYSFGE